MWLPLLLSMKRTRPLSISCIVQPSGSPSLVIFWWSGSQPDCISGMGWGSKSKKSGFSWLCLFGKTSPFSDLAFSKIVSRSQLMSGVLSLLFSSSVSNFLLLVGEPGVRLLKAVLSSVPWRVAVPTQPREFSLSS